MINIIEKKVRIINSLFLYICGFISFIVRDWARIEFNRNRKLTDLGEIRTQAALGRRHLNELKLAMRMAS